MDTTLNQKLGLLFGGGRDFGETTPNRGSLNPLLLVEFFSGNLVCLATAKLIIQFLSCGGLREEIEILHPTNLNQRKPTFDYSFSFVITNTVVNSNIITIVKKYKIKSGCLRDLRKVE